MTRIRARYGRDGYSVVSTGHAGESQTCTAVSAIIQALAGWVQNTFGNGISLEKGNAIIEFPKGEGGETAMDVTVIGLLQVQKAAPDDVKVELIWEE